MAKDRSGNPLIEGRPIIVGGKLMGVCSECGTLIRLDKPLLGALHFCVAR